jgi:hypothetical protein
VTGVAFRLLWLPGCGTRAVGRGVPSPREDRVTNATKDKSPTLAAVTCLAERAGATSETRACRTTAGSQPELF